MEIKTTKRLISELEKLNRNMRNSEVLLSMENALVGGNIKNLTAPEEENARKAIINHILSNSKLSREFVERNISRIYMIRYNKLLDDYITLLNKHDISGIYGDYSIKSDQFKSGDLIFRKRPIYNNDFTVQFFFGLFPAESKTIVYRVNKGDQAIISSINETEYDVLREIAEETFGNVYICGLGNGLFLYLLSKNEKVKSVTVLEEDENAYNLSEKLINIIDTPFSCDLRKVDSCIEYIENNSKMISSVYVDPWRYNDDTFSVYKNYVELEEKYKNIKFLYCNEDGLLYMIKVMILQYLSAKLSTEQYLKYYKVTAPEMFKALEDIKDTLSIPQQLEYYFSTSFAKEIAAKL